MKILARTLTLDLEKGDCCWVCTLYMKIYSCFTHPVFISSFYTSRILHPSYFPREKLFFSQNLAPSIIHEHKKKTKKTRQWRRRETFDDSHWLFLTSSSSLIGRHAWRHLVLASKWANQRADDTVWDANWTPWVDQSWEIHFFLRNGFIRNQDTPGPK